MPSYSPATLVFVGAEIDADTIIDCGADGSSPARSSGVWTALPQFVRLLGNAGRGTANASARRDYRDPLLTLAVETVPS